MITNEGYINIINKFNNLQEEKKHWIKEKQIASEQGDLSENAEYQAAKEEIRKVDKELFKLNKILTSEKVIDISARRKDRIVFGSFVTLESEDNSILKIRLVGTNELTFIEKTDYLPISTISPMGKELLGKEVGDNIVVKDTEYEVISIN